MLTFLYRRGNVIAKFVCLLKHYVLPFEFCSTMKLMVSFRLRPLWIWGKTPPPMGWDANWISEPPWKWRWTEKSRPFWDLKRIFFFQPGISLVKQTTVWSTSVRVFCSCKLWYVLSEGRRWRVRVGFVVDKVALQNVFFSRTSVFPFPNSPPMLHNRICLIYHRRTLYNLRSWQGH